MKKFLLVLVAMVLMSLPVVSEAVQASKVTDMGKQLLLQGYFRGASDTFYIAFFTSSRTCDSTETYYTTTNEVSGTGYPAAGWSLSGFVTGSTSTRAWIDFTTDVSQSPVTFSSQSTCALIYDNNDHHTDCTGNGAPYACCTAASTGCGDTGHKPVLFTLTFAAIQPNGGTLTVTWPAPGADGSTAIVRLGE